MNTTDGPRRTCQRLEYHFFACVLFSTVTLQWAEEENADNGDDDDGDDDGGGGDDDDDVGDDYDDDYYSY